MASEHEHAWHVYTDFDDRVRARCDCGEDAPVATVMSALQQQLAQARVLLERIGKGEPNLFTGELCFYPEEVDFRQLIADLRAFLAPTGE